jgi:hypothetical protein
MTAVRPLGPGERALRVRFGGSWPVVEGTCDPSCVVNKLAPATLVAVYGATDIHEYTLAQVAALGTAATLAEPIRRAFDHMVKAKLEERGVWVSSTSVTDTIPAALLAGALAPVDAHRAQLVATAYKQFVTGAEHEATIAALGASAEDTAAVRVLAATTGDRLAGVAIAVTPLHEGYLVRTSSPPPLASCHAGEHGGHAIAVVLGAAVTMLEDEMPRGGGCRDPVGPRR